MQEAAIYQNISKVRRAYNSWVANEMLEDYALRFAPRSFRKWSEFQVANTAFGSTSFLVLEAIGGFLSINYGFTNAVWAILAVGLIIFITSFPISYYAARYNIDIDLLTRSAGFGYLGSTVTSLIYASFTFTLFALEASIMSLAIELYFDIPLALAHVCSALIVIPLVTFGITTISRLQLWTQPIWLLLLISPYVAIAMHEQEALPTLIAYFSIASSGQDFNWLMFGSASTIAFSMVAQIGEQVDFLRFMPEKKNSNRIRWWLATLTAGPGWIVFGMARQIGGALLAHLCIRHGIQTEHAHEPTQMYLLAYQELLIDPELALGFTTLFVILSQVKINVTNAYAGSLAWSNFFSRITHSHPGRVVWLIFNVLIALLLMELNVFGALEKVLGLFSNLSIAWISAVAAELLINKPLGLSPNIIEFKRAYLPDLNPVGIIATSVASLISILAYLGVFGEYAAAFSGYISLSLAFVLVPLIALFTSEQHYLARDRNLNRDRAAHVCCICENSFEQEDVAFCPAYNDHICSLCCTLDARCLDACKPGLRMDDHLEQFARSFLPTYLTLSSRLRLLRFTLIFMFLVVLTSIFIGTIYYQDLLTVQANPVEFRLLLANFLKVYASLLVFIGLCTWWLILNDESRRVAHEEATKQTQLLLQEIDEHKKTDRLLQQAMRIADNANSAKSRFLSNMSHEIRTPLNSIIGYAHILANDPTIPEHRQQAVETLKRSGEHLSGLVEDILDIARIEARKFEFKNEAIHLQNFIKHLVDIFKVQAENKGLTFNCYNTNTLPTYVRGDEKRVGQILINLLGNALKFTQQGGITFTTGFSGGVMTFQVIDTGCGIEQDQLADIYQPFTRLNNQESTTLGSGLGLTVSKILTEIMGGELAVESILGVGSSFKVRLLLPSIQIDTAVTLEENIIGYQGARKKILVVDDQIDHRQLILAVLEPLGFYLDEACSGEECLQKVRMQIPNLILLDVSMTGIDGIETLLQLRQRGHKMPIIMLSANAYPEDRQAAFNAGCQDFLTKPLVIPELMLKLKQQLNLRWMCRDLPPIQERPENAPMILPSDTVLQELRTYIRIGDLQGFNKALNGFDTQSEYQPFMLRLRKLAREFRLAEIKALLNILPTQKSDIGNS